jgi:hypothetical protein
MPKSISAVQHHRTASAEPAHPGFEHTQRERHGDGGVHCIAAAPEHGSTNLRCTPVLRSDDTMLAANGRFGEAKRGAEVVHGRSATRRRWCLHGSTFCANPLWLGAARVSHGPAAADGVC